MKTNSRYMKAFIAEAEENLQNMNSALLELEKDPGKRELIDEMFRHAHTIKGGAASMEYQDISTLAHEMESLMDRLRSENIEPDSSVIDILFETLDMLETLVQAVAKEEKMEIEITPLIHKLKTASITAGTKRAVSGKGRTPSKPDKDAEVKEGQSFQIKIKLHEDCALRSVRAFMALKNLEKIGNIIQTTPEAKDIEDEKFDLSFTVLFATKENAKAIRKAIESVSEIDSVDIVTFEQPSTKLPGFGTTQTVRVDVKRLDNLMNLVGELVIDKIGLMRISSIHEIDELTESLTHLDKLISNIQDEVMQARLVPVNVIFNRFPRMVRDLAKKQKKKIDFVVEGTEIEVDRTILDKITDPIIHMLRNAVDHGIEPSTKRKSAGKPETGIIKLIASREKEDVVIEVSDDGKGIDADQVLDMAIKKGMITEEESYDLDDKEKLMLIATPGFSTQEEATDVSGRGVGVDVVKTAMESIGGTMTIDSEKNMGTKMVLKLPLTTAIARGLLVKVQQETFVVPLANVQEIVNIKADDVKTIKGEEAFLLRGEIVPLIRLDSVLNLNSGLKETNSEFPALVVEVEGKRGGLMVNSLLGQEEVVIKSLVGVLKGVKGYAGATILGDGKVVFILDVASLIL